MAAKRAARRRETALAGLTGLSRRETALAALTGLTGRTGLLTPTGRRVIMGHRRRITPFLTHDLGRLGRARRDGRAGRAGRAWVTRRAWVAWVAGVLGLLCGVVGVAGCSSGPQPGATGTSCGLTRTGANVPVQIDVARGTVSCDTVLRVERDYATLVRDGDLRGNGGGAPVTVDGWICEGYTTPEAIQTGDASECHTATAEVVAVLAVPSATPSTALAASSRG